MCSEASFHSKLSLARRGQLGFPCSHPPWGTWRYRSEQPSTWGGSSRFEGRELFAPSYLCTALPENLLEGSRCPCQMYTLNCAPFPHGCEFNKMRPTGLDNGNPGSLLLGWHRVTPLPSSPAAWDHNQWVFSWGCCLPNLREGESLSLLIFTARCYAGSSSGPWCSGLRSRCEIETPLSSRECFCRSNISLA